MPASSSPPIGPALGHDGVENPVPGFAEFRELQEVVEATRAEPTAVQSFTVVGSYRLF